MILNMSVARCVAGFSRTMSCVIICMWAVFSVASHAAERWDSQGAAEAFQLARQKRDAIIQSVDPTIDQYLDCARTYRKVHFKDPHYGRTGDAIYEEALIYQEAADRFQRPAYYKTAARRLRLLVKDYGLNQNCRDALKRLASIYSKHLGDEIAAEEAYKTLQARYRYSNEAIQRIRAESASEGVQPVVTAKPEQPEPAKSTMAPNPRPASLSTVQSIRFWSTSNYTRVIIDMDSDAKYVKQRLHDPNRVYFDISNSRLDRNLTRDFTVGDEILQQVRVAQNRSDVVRIVFDIAAIGGLSVLELHDPFRIVIDLQREGAPTPPAPISETKVTSKPPANAAQKPQPPPMAITEMRTPSSSAKSTTTATSSEIQSKKDEPPAPPLPKEAIPPAYPESKPPRPLSVTELPASAPEEAKQAKAPASASGDQNSDSNKRTLEQPPQAAQVQPSRTIPANPGPQKPTAAGSDALAPSPKSTAAGKRGETETAALEIKAPPASKPEPMPLPKQASPTSQGDRTLTRMLGLKVGRIVIDPGHGGHDQGTTGPGGLLEKDLVLLLARSLRKMIEEKVGAEVVLTRDDDTFVSLEERTAIANRHKADLFVSIHANSSRIRSISGVETYYLDFAKTDAEREIAARENATADGNVRDLEDLIKKIAQADKSSESRELASIVQKKLYSGTRQVLPSTKDRGVRSAPFVVLIGANMPSVLAEVAFISNPKVERVLRKESAKQSLVKALFTGIEGYMKTLGSDVVYNQISSQPK
jgi:N-acetylmuramoyl-L-alanine amidase